MMLRVVLPDGDRSTTSSISCAMSQPKKFRLLRSRPSCLSRREIRASVLSATLAPSFAPPKRHLAAPPPQFAQVRRALLTRQAPPTFLHFGRNPHLLLR